MSVFCIGIYINIKTVHTGELTGCCRATGRCRRSFGQREAGGRSQASMDGPERSSSCGKKQEMSVLELLFKSTLNLDTACTKSTLANCVSST